MLLGVTNPFFVKAMDHWPHILKVVDIPEGAPVGDKQEKTRSVYLLPFYSESESYEQ